MFETMFDVADSFIYCKLFVVHVIPLPLYMIQLDMHWYVFPTFDDESQRGSKLSRF